MRWATALVFGSAHCPTSTGDFNHLKSQCTSCDQEFPAQGIEEMNFNEEMLGNMPVEHWVRPALAEQLSVDRDSWVTRSWAGD